MGSLEFLGRGKCGLKHMLSENIRVGHGYYYRVVQYDLDPCDDQELFQQVDAVGGAEEEEKLAADSI